jgi:hypothetical protein
MIDQEEGFTGIWLKPVDARRYAWTRVAFAIVIFFQMLHHWPYRNGLYGYDGFFTKEFSRTENPGLHLPDAFMLDLSWWPALMIATGCVAALFLVWGKWSRVALAIVYIVLMVCLQRPPLASNGWDVILTNFAFILLFSPLASGWTPVRLWKSRKETALGRLNTGMLPRYGLVLLQIQVVVIYWQTVIERGGNKFWISGDFMNYYLLSYHSRFAGPWVHEWEGLLNIATYLTCMIELAIPVLLWIRVTRWIGVAAGAALHLGIAVMSNDLSMFSLTMLMSYTPFLGGLPSEEWEDE